MGAEWGRPWCLFLGQDHLSHQTDDCNLASLADAAEPGAAVWSAHQQRGHTAMFRAFLSRSTAYVSRHQV